MSKAALIRASLAKELRSSEADTDGAWSAMTGWLEDGGVDDIDTAIYGRSVSGTGARTVDP